MNGIKLLMQTAGIDLDQVKADAAQAITNVQETLGAIAGALNRIEAHAVYTRTAVDRLTTIVSGGPPMETATSEFALRAFDADPTLEARVLADLTSDKAA